MSNSLNEPRIFRAALSTYIVVGVMGTVIVAMTLPSNSSHASQSDWNLPITFAVIAVAILLVIRIYRIDISDDSVLYRSPLRGTRSIRYEDIERVRTSITLNAGAVPTENRAGPMYRLELSPRAGLETTDTIVINMKIFRFEDIRSLIETLEKRLPAGSVETKNKSSSTEPVG
jgi:hypothetical protein